MTIGDRRMFFNAASAPRESVERGLTPSAADRGMEAANESA